MAKLDLPKDSATVQAIYAAYDSKQQPRQQRRVGASQAGTACDRALWYGFRWWTAPKRFDGRLLRLFETGHQAEPRFAENLRAIGCEVHLTDAAGNQFEFTACDGHLVCKIDGAIRGLPEAPRAWHVAEFKTHSAKSFKELKAKGVRKAKPEHYCQCVLGMQLSGMPRCLYMAVNKDTDELYSERFRIEECRADAAALLERIQAIVDSQEPPPRIDENPNSFACRYCDYWDACHSCLDPQPTCRSCRYSAPAENGTWVCAAKETTLTNEQQQAGCDEYVRLVELSVKAPY